MACQQFAIADDLSPRRRRVHLVAPGPKPPKENTTLSLVYGAKSASIFEIPTVLPTEEYQERPVVEHNSHACGIAKHFWAYPNPTRCTLSFKAPCTTCEERVQASYVAGRYAR